MKNFGLERVVEPADSLPVTAWKLDNSPELRRGEIRVRLSSIVFERENFFQLCSICENDDDKIRERIIKIVNERGKLHNPYTESSALFVGTVEEISPGFDLGEIKVGDDVISMTPMAGLPAFIEEIGEIDIYYGRIQCTGYVICFETLQLMKVEDPYSRRDRKSVV